MIVGNVLATGEVVIQLLVRGTNGEVARVHTLVDTGFNDFLALPPWLIEKLALPPGDISQFLLADGEKRRTQMMQGCHLGIDVVANGRVEIRPIV